MQRTGDTPVIVAATARDDASSASFTPTCFTPSTRQMPVSWSRKNPTVGHAFANADLERLQQIFGDIDGNGFQPHGVFCHSGAFYEAIEYALVT